MKGHNDILVKLIEKGADVSAKGFTGKSALHLAAEHGHTEATTHLLSHGALINAKSEDNATVFSLAESGNFLTKTKIHCFD